MANSITVLLLSGMILVGVLVAKGVEKDQIRAQFIVKNCKPTDLYYRDRYDNMKIVLKCKISPEE